MSLERATARNQGRVPDRGDVPLTSSVQPNDEGRRRLVSDAAVGHRLSQENDLDLMANSRAQ